MKILFLNNYRMSSDDLGSWKGGMFPGQHLWGIAHLPIFGIDVEILPLQKFTKINNYWRIQRLLNANVYSMISYDQQLRVLFSFDFDVVYSACQNQTLFLSKLRSLGLFRKPIVTVVHHPLWGNQLSKSYFKGHDKLLFLSEKIMHTAEERYPEYSHKYEKFHWGTDINFYSHNQFQIKKKKESEFVIVTAGKSNRDYVSLIKAVENIHCKLKIYCSERSRPKGIALPKNVDVKWGKNDRNAVGYRELLNEYFQADAVVIPLFEVDALAGLTSLFDAIAIGKPVIMTRNPYIDIDIEEEGIGIWVDPGDVSQWRNALLKLKSQPENTKKMGEKAYQLCCEKYDIKNCSANLAGIFKKLKNKRN